MGNALAKDTVALITESKWEGLVQLLAEHAGSDDAGAALSRVVRGLPEGRGKDFENVKKITPLGALIMSPHDVLIAPPKQADSLDFSEGLFLTVKNKKGKKKDSSSPSRVRKLRVVCAVVEKLLSLPGFDVTQRWSKRHTVIGHCLWRCFRCANALARATPPPLSIENIYVECYALERAAAYYFRSVEVNPEYKSALPLLQALGAKFGHTPQEVCNDSRVQSLVRLALSGLDAPFWGYLYLHSPSHVAEHHMLFPECALLAEVDRPEGAEGKDWKNPFIEKLNSSAYGREHLLNKAQNMWGTDEWSSRYAAVTRMVLEDDPASTKEVLMLAAVVTKELQQCGGKGNWSILMEDVAREPSLYSKSRNKAICALVASPHVGAACAFLRGAEAGTLDSEEFLDAVLNSNHTSSLCKQLLTAFVNFQLGEDWAALHVVESFFNVRESLHPEGCDSVNGIEYAAVKGKVSLAKFLARHEELSDAALRDILDSAEEYVACENDLRNNEERKYKAHRSAHRHTRKRGGGVGIYQQQRNKMEAERQRRRADHERMMMNED